MQGGDDSDAGAVPEPEIAVPQDKDNKGTQALEEALSGLPPRYEYLWQRYGREIWMLDVALG